MPDAAGVPVMGAFAEAFRTFAVQGIPVIPTRPDVPSMPMVRHPAQFRVSTCRKLTENPRFNDANAGLWTGRTSGLTIVDIDSTDPAHLAEVIHIFGDTRLKISTPSGGVHLYYGHKGEKRRTRIFGKALPVDILGSGLAVAPPSIRPATGKKAAGVYQVIEGDLTALAGLPCIRAGALPPQEKPDAGSPREARIDLRGMREGDGRDNALFNFARHAAARTETEQELVAAVLAENAKMVEPLTTTIAMQKVAQAWKYKMHGKLIVAGDRAAVMELHTINICQGRPGSFMLLAYLRSHHPAAHEFAIVPEAIALSIGLSPNTIRKDRDWLVAAGLLILIRRGGGRDATGGGIPSVYRLSKDQAGTLQNLRGIELNTLSPLPRSNSTGEGSFD